MIHSTDTKNINTDLQKIPARERTLTNTHLPLNFEKDCVYVGSITLYLLFILYSFLFTQQEKAHTTYSSSGLDFKSFHTHNDVFHAVLQYGYQQTRKIKSDSRKIY